MVNPSRQTDGDISADVRAIIYTLIVSCNMLSKYLAQQPENFLASAGGKG